MLSVNTSSSWVKARGFLFAAINHSTLLPTENALASGANASNTNRRAYIIFYHRTRYSCTITTLINNRITRFTRNGLLRNKMRVRCASLSFATGHRVSYYFVSPESSNTAFSLHPVASAMLTFPKTSLPHLPKYSAWNSTLANVNKSEVFARVSPFLADWISRVHLYTRSRIQCSHVYTCVEAKNRFRAFPSWHAGSVRNIQIYSGIIYERLIHGVPRILLRGTTRVCGVCGPLFQISSVRWIRLRFAVVRPGWI